MLVKIPTGNATPSCRKRSNEISRNSGIIQNIRVQQWQFGMAILSIESQKTIIWAFNVGQKEGLKRREERCGEGRFVWVSNQCIPSHSLDFQTNATKKREDFEHSHRSEDRRPRSSLVCRKTTRFSLHALTGRMSRVATFRAMLLQLIAL